MSTIHFDREGAIAPCIQPIEAMGITLHSSTSKVPIAERKIQTLKGRVRSILMSLPYSLCRTLLVMCVLFCASRLNMVSSSSRPNRICSFESLTGRKLDMQRDLKYGFGDYVEVPVRHTDNHVGHPRTDTAIAVMSTGNLNGDWKFYKPFTGSYITRSTCQPALPVTEGLIQKLNNLAHLDGTSKNDNTVLFPEFIIGTPDGSGVMLPPAEIYDDDATLSTLEVRSPNPAPETSDLTF